MPLSFENLANAFEAKFAHDEEVRFRMIARRDKLFAQWLSAEHKLPATEASSLHDAVLAVRDGPGHDAALLTLVRTRFARDQGSLPNNLEAALASCTAKAQEQILNQVNS